MPNGSVLTLFRHDGHYLIRSDGAELMSSRHHLSEDRLAELVCDPLATREAPRVLIGGLGLGFTLRAALRALGADARVDLVELSDAVIRWNRNPEYDLARAELADERVTLIHADAARVIADSVNRYDGIMLDVDLGVETVQATGNGALYTAVGIRRTVAALRPGGRVAWWSAAAEPAFETRLRGANLKADIVPVRTHATGGATHVIYLVSHP